jgi:hypothetical protein
MPQPEWIDAKGARIKMGDTVNLVRVYDPGLGSMRWMLDNGRAAEVIGFGRTRVKLFFPHADRVATVAPRYLVVV